MFNNAQQFNKDESQIFKDSVALQLEARKLASIEKSKPDTDFVAGEGRKPRPEGIQYKGETWAVGDWVHIRNANDISKPIVAQIYRTWEDADGQEWINACWYYRPEQTVHHFEKHFWPHEVLKTGQYRDHHVEELVDRCFVMFYTRFTRGRPKGLPSNREVYVCEARYNNNNKINKIKTWASCLPDETRDKDYEMDLFDNLASRKIKKQPSPLLGIFKDNLPDASDPPEPRWGAENAPPIIGGLYKGSRDENVSCECNMFFLSDTETLHSNPHLLSPHPSQFNHHKCQPDRLLEPHPRKPKPIARQLRAKPTWIVPIATLLQAFLQVNIQMVPAHLFLM